MIGPLLKKVLGSKNDRELKRLQPQVDRINALEAQIDEQEQLVAYGKQARREFPKDYGRLVVLGKAVPDQADSASLMVELNSIANRTDVEFRGITLGQGSGGEGTTTPAPAPPPGAPGANPCRTPPTPRV